MGAKTKRLLIIKKIISSMKIGTQDELLSVLMEKGFKLTQATLSRDLKFLKIGKVSDVKKGYIYFLPDAVENSKMKDTNSSADNFPINGFISLKFSNNLGVMRTKAGYASSIASYIDMRAPFEILGTIAGDDTILIIPVEGARPKNIKNALVMIIPELEDKIT
jgi:transcriptional regulator of arginine metabolism